MAEDGPSDPSQAFEDLRAEVSVLRKAVEALPDTIQKNRPPDYAEDLGVIGNALDEIAGQLEDIQKSPALRLSPEQQGAAIAQGGRAMLNEAAEALRRATQSAEQEGGSLSYMIGNMVRYRQIWRERLWIGGVALAIGLVLSPFLASWLPFGLNTRVSALVMMRSRWDAGQAVMQAANPSGWAQLATDANLAHDNRDKIDGCHKAANKAKQDERCVITVRPATGG